MSIVERNFCESERPLFDEVGAEYRNHLETFRGMVRSYVTRTNLQRHLGTDIGRAIDVGSGSGGDAFWLAGLGIDVTMVEPSDDMRRAAEHMLQLEPEHIQARIATVAGDHAAAVAQFGESGTFDLVMCHGVMMYQDDPPRFLSELARLCRPGGKLSLLTKNASSLAFRPGLQGDFEQALEAIEADASIGNLGAGRRPRRCSS